MPDEIAVEVLKRCNGTATVGAIADELAAAYEVLREVVLEDVSALCIRRQGVLTA